MKKLSIANRIQEIEERISEIDDAIEDIETKVKENTKCKTLLVIRPPSLPEERCPPGKVLSGSRGGSHLVSMVPRRTVCTVQLADCMGNRSSETGPVSGIHLKPEGRSEYQTSVQLPCKKRACQQRVL